MAMNETLRTLLRLAQMSLILAMAGATYFAVHMWLDGEEAVHALPEFTERTAEPCGACHVNPGGGGPRTLRGLLWAARGRPDDIPQLPGMLISPYITDGLELYDIACAGCHGTSGEGLYAIDLAARSISKAATRTFIRRGIPELDMPAFEGQFTDEQLEALSAFVAELSLGPPLPSEFLLPPAEFTCLTTIPMSCGGN